MFPISRPRRLRQHPVLRELVRETTLSVRDLILPLFVRPGRGVRKEIASMPGNYQLSVDALVNEVGDASELGVRAFILFGIPAHKDAVGASACDDDGIVQQALRRCGRRSRTRCSSPTNASASTPTTATAARCVRSAAASTWTTMRRCRCWRNSASATPALVPMWWRPAA